MTKAEMDKRLSTMTPDLIERIRDMIRLGYGNIGIFHETPAKIAQINAVFALAQGTWE